MFKKLKDKIAEEVKSSPQRIQQFTQSVTEKIQNATSEENFFSIGDDDVPSSSPIPEPGFSNVSLSNYAAPNSERFRKNSNSSLASDMSFLPHYESSTNLYHLQLQSDLDVSASELEDNASTSSQLGHLSKEQIYSAFQKSQMRYHKYRGRYTDIANHYKELERENGKMKAVLVETQDKALRRVAELREQCGLEQKAKAHLENALRVELDEKQYVIHTLKEKINLLQTNQGESTSVKVSDEDQEILTRDLKDARVEIETLNLKIQEMKANTIIFSSKEVDMKKKINDLEEILKQKASENLLVLERERENNLIIAQTKMELHTEIQNRDLEIENLKHDIETLRVDIDKYENEPKTQSNLQIQNSKLIEKVEELSQRCKKYEGEILKSEQQKIEIVNLNESVRSLKAQVRSLEEEKIQLSCNDELKNLEALRDSKNVEIESLKKAIFDKNNEINELNEKNAELNSRLLTLQNEIKQQAGDYEAKITTFREDTKQNLLSLESKIEEKLKKKFDEKENVLRNEFQNKVQQLSQTDEDVQSIRLKLISKEEEVEKLSSQVVNLELKLQTLVENYHKLETNHLELISENNDVLNSQANLGKQNKEFQKEVQGLREHSVVYEEENFKLKEQNVVLSSQIKSLQEEVTCVQHQTGNLEKILSENQTYVLEVENIKKELQAVNGQKSEILNLQEGLKNQIAVLEREKDTSKSQNEDLLSNIQELKEKNENLLASFNESKEVLSSLQQQRVEDDVFKNNLNEEFSLLKTELESKRQKLQQVESNFEEVKEEQSNSLTDIKILNEKLILLEEENKKNQADLKKTYEALTLNQKANLERDEELNNLKRKFEEVETERHYFENKSLQLASDAANLSKIVTNNEDSTKEFKLQCDNRTEELENLKLKHEKVIGENKKLLKKVTTFTEQADTFNADIEKLQSRIKELSVEKQELDAEVVNLQNEVLNKDALEEQNKKAILELGELQQRIKESTLETEKITLQQIELQNTLEERNTELESVKLKKSIPTINSEKVLTENKILINQVNQLQDALNNFEKQKSSLEAQLRELENQYTDITHERQLLQDEIQELKASPIIITNSIDKNIENTSTNSGEGNKIQKDHDSEINDLHEKLVQYKSLDLTNRSSIQFYENELQRLKNKNEKLNRKLDETLVTLNHCTELSTSTETVYLKNVLYNYMLGKEGVVLARVIAAVCKFDDAQTETILQREQQKQTLLGQLGFL